MPVKLSRWFPGVSRSYKEDVVDSEQSDTLLEQSTPNTNSRSNRLCYVYFIAFIASLVLNMHFWFQQQQIMLSDSGCSSFTSQYRSPIQKDVKIRYETIQFNGSFMKESVFRQPASPEVDEAWESLGTDYLPIVVAEDEASLYGILPGQVKRRKDQGGGFLANVEVLHHLHCLNLLRKASYYSYGYYSKKGEGPFSNSDEVIRLHFSHCLDILRQQIMCTADFGIFGQNWVRDPAGPFVDFNTKHKCKNFEDIRQWAERNQVMETDRVEFRQGDTILAEIP